MVVTNIFHVQILVAPLPFSLFPNSNIYFIFVITFKCLIVLLTHTFTKSNMTLMRSNIKYNIGVEENKFELKNKVISEMKLKFDGQESSITSHSS